MYDITGKFSCAILIYKLEHIEGWKVPLIVLNIFQIRSKLGTHRIPYNSEILLSTQVQSSLTARVLADDPQVPVPILTGTQLKVKPWTSDGYNNRQQI